MLTLAMVSTSRKREDMDIATTTNLVLLPLQLNNGKLDSEIH
jgi:hypothetical protein